MNTRASQTLNKQCFCIGLDRPALAASLERVTNDPDFFDALIESRPHLFAAAPVFLARSDAEAMMAIVAAIEAAVRLPGYRAAALAQAPLIAETAFGPAGALMGYDFHLTEDGPKLIEINTNAGGAFLNAFLARAQQICCAPSPAPKAHAFEAAVVSMFEREWARQGRSGRPGRIAIVDDEPAQQYLYPEFVLARQLLANAGYDAVIADAADLRFEAGVLRHRGAAIDLVYNRLTDFALDEPAHAALRQAYAVGAVVVTPNPHNHALCADKRNLVLLSDPARLQGWGLPARQADQLERQPQAVEVTAQNAAALWAERARYFFKPIAGHGGKAVYRGDKLTKSAWQTISRGGYIAQARAAPSERAVRVGGEERACKLDVRLYTYDGVLLLAAARLYQGQTTNFRTPGGGFAPVLLV